MFQTIEDYPSQKNRSQTMKTWYYWDNSYRSYFVLSNLNKHKCLKHVALKPRCICDVCEYKSNWKGNLEKHVVSRHSQTSKLRHKCDKCLRSYMWLADLHRHFAAVQPQFICDYCDYKPNMKSYNILRDAISSNLETI